MFGTFLHLLHICWCVIEHVWDIHFDSDTNVVDVYVRYLRRKVDEPFPVSLIHTVRGRGYVLREPS